MGRKACRCCRQQVRATADVGLYTGTAGLWVVTSIRVTHRVRRRRRAQTIRQVERRHRARQGVHRAHVFSVRRPISPTARTTGSRPFPADPTCGTAVVVFQWGLEYTCAVAPSNTNGSALTVLAERSWFTACPPAVVVDEASDVAFPGGIASTVKARASPADQSGRGKGHRLPCHVCDTYRVHTGLRYRRGRIDAIAHCGPPRSSADHWF